MYRCMSRNRFQFESGTINGIDPSLYVSGFMPDLGCV
jgi:hypothetical protein